MKNNSLYFLIGNTGNRPAARRALFNIYTIYSLFQSANTKKQYAYQRKRAANPCVKYGCPATVKKYLATAICFILTNSFPAPAGISRYILERKSLYLLVFFTPAP